MRWRDYSLADVQRLNAARGLPKPNAVKAPLAPAPRSKYHNTKIRFNGAVFDSQKEFQEWIKLRDAEQRGEISELRRQVPFELCCPTPEGKQAVVAIYIADFCYTRHNAFVVADAKGVQTRGFQLKAKWLKLQYGLDILLL